MEQDKGATVVACLRCRLEVSVISDNCGLRLSYDFDHWKRQCCCRDRPSPADCCSFLTLEGLLNTLPRPPKD
jgi:hypothetical protein